MEKVRLVYTHPEQPEKQLEVAGWFFENQNPPEQDYILIRRHDGIMVDVPKECIVQKHVIPG